jgi:GDP-mannose 6-dehydrogenase
LSLSISIFGLGYVGSVSAACLASLDHRIIGVDVNPSKVQMIASGQSPIAEAEMPELVAEGHRSGRLLATTSSAEAVANSEVSLICVGTPGLKSGKLDLRYLEKVAGEIGTALPQKESAHTVIVRSTVLPGTTESVIVPIIEKTSGRKAGSHFYVVYNPEFMREGTAVADFRRPPYTVLGAAHPSHLVLARELYRTTNAPLFETTIAVAEMVKYASNAFHAVKVAFANEIGTLAKHLRVDTQAVSGIFTADTRLNISAAYLSPGFAFGGSCLPKDVGALIHTARALDLKLPLIEALLPSNEEHVERGLEAVMRTGRRKIAQLGLSFKAGTDDLRESPHVYLVKRLLGEGCEVRVWDPDVSFGCLVGSNRQYIEDVIPHIGSLLTSSFEEVIGWAEVVVIANKSVPKRELMHLLRKDQFVVDLANLERESRSTGDFSYEGICW